MRLREVEVTDSAETDLEAIIRYIAEADSPAAADNVLLQLLDIIDGLAAFPDRGSRPLELAALGRHEYRQAFFKPYRLIYEVTPAKVIVRLIADGRRDLSALLQQRLLDQ